ncbi:MAG: RNA polymerase sigma factor [Acidobacteriota bacterium]
MPHLAYSRRDSQQRLAEASDRDLLAALQQDEESALDLLIQRKTEALSHAVYRILGDAEETKDVVQMAFVRIWENRQRYDGRYSPNTWIYRIATNLAIDHLRSRRTRERSQEPVRYHLRQVSSESPTGPGRLAEREVMAIFQDLAEELTERQRTIFVLREIEGRSSAEVSEILGCRKSTVRNHLFNARKILRRAVLHRYPEYAGKYGGDLQADTALTSEERA